MQQTSLFSLLEQPAAQRLGIVVLGPNASGKTSATRKAVKDLGPVVRLVNLDNEVAFRHQTDDKLRPIWFGPQAVVMLEGSRLGTVIARLTSDGPLGDGQHRSFELVLTVTSPETMRDHIRSRCERNGKRFRADFWSGKHLETHCLRAAREVDRLFAGAHVTRFPIGSDYSGHDALVQHLRRRVESCLL